MKTKVPKTIRKEQAYNITRLFWKSAEAAALEAGELVLRASQERVPEAYCLGKEAPFVVYSGIIHLLIDVNTLDTPPHSSIRNSVSQFT